ncbi:MAG: hypothetical protein ING75_17095 [Rhodocyclaceae bacterium]|nr:hypothetical protein [Rhodocyclaceae bacterium]
MPSPAFNAQGSTVQFGQTQGTAITATAGTAANPVVITATNTTVAGDLVVCTSSTGQAQLASRAFIVTAPSGTSFTLFGEDGTGRSALTAGTFRPWTLTAVAGADAFQTASSGGSANNTIDVTTLTSVSKEYVAGLPDSPSLSFTMVPSLRDATFKYLRTVQKARTTIPIYIKVPNPDTTATLQSAFFHICALGFVQSITEFSLGVDQPVSAQVQFKCTNGLEIYTN